MKRTSIRAARRARAICSRAVLVEACEPRTHLSATRVTDIAGGAAASLPSFLTELNGVLYFAAADASGGNELWRSDGTTTGTARVADIRTGPAGSNPANLTAVGNLLFFSASTVDGGTELWRSDGTEAGTFRVKDINAGPLDSAPGSLTAVGNVLMFAATDVSGGRELWRSDGTDGGTFRVKDIHGTGSSFPDRLVAAGSTLYFTASDGAAGIELWKSDGTATGTAMVKDIRPGPAASFPGPLVALGGRILFAADDGVTGLELWQSDGTETGTARVADINPGTAGSQPTSLTAVGSIVYFAADDGVRGRELWRSDGTGVAMVADVRTGPGSSSPASIAALGTTIFFAADDGQRGVELWKSDGVSGAAIVADIIPGTGSSFPDSLKAAAGVMFFAAEHPDFGLEVFRTDGTTTAVVRDINAGQASSEPDSFTPFNGGLYFTADDGVSGAELWRILPPAAAIGGPLTVTVGDGLVLDSSTSGDPDPAETLTYAWDLDNNGTFETAGASPVFSVSRTGSYPVALRVTNSVGLSSTTSAVVTVTDPAWLVPAAGASYTLAGPGAAKTFVLESGTADVVAAPPRFAGLTLGAGTTLRVAAGGAITTVTESLALAPSATFDLRDNDLLVDYAPGNSPLAAVSQLIATAARGADLSDVELLWSGPGITSGTARAIARHQIPGRATTLGVSEASLYTARTGATAFDDIPLDGSAVIVKYTYAADATLDGRVSDKDVDVLYANYQDSRRPALYAPFVTGRTFSDADFTFDGLTDDRDLDLLASTVDPLAPVI